MTKSKIKELRSNHTEYILYILRELVRTRARLIIDDVYPSSLNECYKFDGHGTHYFISLSTLISESQLEILSYTAQWHRSDVAISYKANEVKDALNQLTDDERLYLILTSNVLKTIYYKEDENEQSNI